MVVISLVLVWFRFVIVLKVTSLVSTRGDVKVLFDGPGTAFVAETAWSGQRLGAIASFELI